MRMTNQEWIDRFLQYLRIEKGVADNTIASYRHDLEMYSAHLRGADLRGTRLAGADLSGAHLDGANFFKALLDHANLAGAFLSDAQFLNCAQLVVARNWQSAFRDAALGCGASLPETTIASK